MKKIIMVLALLSIIVLSGCDVKIDKCKQAATLDHNMEEPTCISSMAINRIDSTLDCDCYGYICKEYSCVPQANRIQFNLKN